MVKRTAAASVTATIGTATATLVVVGAVLAWPAISSCSGDPSGLGACLREALADRGLVSPEDQAIGSPEAPDKPAGWLDARATEMAPRLVPSIELNDIGPTLEVEDSDRPMAVAPKVALAPAADVEPLALKDLPPVSPTTPLNPTGEITATGAASAGDQPVRVALIGPAGRIRASVTDGAPEIPATTVLVPRDGGALTVSAPAGQSGTLTTLAVSPLPVPAAVPSDPAPAGPVVELTAAVEPVPVPDVRRVPPVEPQPVIAFDPAFPNVLVLPAPAEGEDSSIRQLTLD